MNLSRVLGPYVFLFRFKGLKVWTAGRAASFSQKTQKLHLKTLSYVVGELTNANQLKLPRFPLGENAVTRCTLTLALPATTPDRVVARPVFEPAQLRNLLEEVRCDGTRYVLYLRRILVARCRHLRA